MKLSRNSIASYSEKIFVTLVLPKAAEDDTVLWLNTLRKDGSPVSRVMLQLQAKHLAKEHDLEDKFAASPTWVKLFLRRHRLSLRARTRQGQTTPEDAQEAAKEFRPIVLKTIVEKKCIQTISKRGVKTVWVKCSNKDKARATAMLLADWVGRKLAPFIVFKCAPSTIKSRRDDNEKHGHEFSPTMWKREIKPLQECNDCQIYGNNFGMTSVVIEPLKSRIMLLPLM
ncbi:unnamed protein product [Phytophthora fragariaefolia]|uniref:Unnamed protein product n=1 Tax=Phytophthora fragariaefolia TaxID=1490495 RepID=A0A9W6YKZ0_9STRA|nr:unnamed protein product [Phytophthora fragariaefolia]